MGFRVEIRELGRQGSIRSCVIKGSGESHLLNVCMSCRVVGNSIKIPSPSNSITLNFSFYFHVEHYFR